MLPCEVTCVGPSDREHLVTSLWDTQLAPRSHKSSGVEERTARQISSASLLTPAQHSEPGPALKML